MKKGSLRACCRCSVQVGLLRLLTRIGSRGQTDWTVHVAPIDRFHTRHLTHVFVNLERRTSTTSKTYQRTILPMGLDLGSAWSRGGEDSKEGMKPLCQSSKSKHHRIHSEIHSYFRSKSLLYQQRGTRIMWKQNRMKMLVSPPIAA